MKPFHDITWFKLTKVAVTKAAIYKRYLTHIEGGLWNQYEY